MQAKFLRPDVIAFENVRGLLVHRSWPTIKLLVAIAGYQIRWIEVVDLADQLPHRRNRLLAVLGSAGIPDVSPGKVASWIKRPGVVLKPGVHLLPFQEALPFAPPLPEKVLQKYLDPDFAPHARHWERRDPSRFRLVRAGQVMCCIQASYGFAHELPLSLLRSKGLHSRLVSQNGKIRFACWVEILALLGNCSRIVLKRHLRGIATILGNAISVPHAALALANAMCCLPRAESLGFVFDPACVVAHVIAGIPRSSELVISSSQDIWCCDVPHDRQQALCPRVRVRASPALRPVIEDDECSATCEWTFPVCAPTEVGNPVLPPTKKPKLETLWNATNVESDAKHVQSHDTTSDGDDPQSECGSDCTPASLAQSSGCTTRPSIRAWLWRLGSFVRELSLEPRTTVAIAIRAIHPEGLQRVALSPEYEASAHTLVGDIADEFGVIHFDLLETPDLCSHGGEGGLPQPDIMPDRSSHALQYLPVRVQQGTLLHPKLCELDAPWDILVRCSQILGIDCRGFSLRLGPAVLPLHDPISAIDVPPGSVLEMFHATPHPLCIQGYDVPSESLDTSGTIAFFVRSALFPTLCVHSHPAVTFHDLRDHIVCHLGCDLSDAFFCQGIHQIQFQVAVGEVVNQDHLEILVHQRVRGGSIEGDPRMIDTWSVSFNAEFGITFLTRHHRLPRMVLYVPTHLPPGFTLTDLQDTRQTVAIPMFPDRESLNFLDNWRSHRDEDALPEFWTGSTTFRTHPLVETETAPLRDPPAEGSGDSGDGGSEGRDIEFLDGLSVETEGSGSVPRIAFAHPEGLSEFLCSPVGGHCSEPAEYCRVVLAWCGILVAVWLLRLFCQVVRQGGWVGHFLSLDTSVHGSLSCSCQPEICISSGAVFILWHGIRLDAITDSDFPPSQSVFAVSGNIYQVGRIYSQVCRCEMRLASQCYTLNVTLWALLLSVECRVSVISSVIGSRTVSLPVQGFLCRIGRFFRDVLKCAKIHLAVQLSPDPACVRLNDHIQVRQIFVQLPTGRTLLLRIDRHACPSSIIRQCSDIAGESFSDCWLLCGSSILSRFGDLCWPAVRNHSTLVLSSRLRGGVVDTQPKPGPHLRCKGRILSLLIARGVAAEKACPVVEELLQQEHAQFANQLVGCTDRQAFDVLCQFAEKHQVQIKDLLPRPKERKKALLGGKVKKQTFTQSDLQFLQFKPELFQGADGRDATVHKSWAMNHRGLVLEVPDNLQLLMSGKKFLSPDELSILLVRFLKVDAPFSCTAVTVPANGPNGDVLLNLYLLHLGQKGVKVRSPKDVKIKFQECATLHLSVYEDEWNHPAWRDLASGPVKSVMQSLGIKEATAVWGRNWSNGKKSCPIPEASQFGVFVSVPSGAAMDVLRQSGLGTPPIYVNPKPPSKGGVLPALFADNRVIWTGKDRVDALRATADAPKHLGLVRNRGGIGIRIPNSIFEVTWKALGIAKPLPPDVEVKSKWTLQGAPASAVATEVQEWLSQLKWKARVLKRLRVGVWLIGAASEPPYEGPYSINLQPVLLIKREEADVPTSTVVAGSYSRSHPAASSSDKQDGDILQIHDPWARFPRPQPVSSDASTKMCHDRIDQLQKDLGTLTEKVQQQDLNLQTEVGQLRTDVSRDLASTKASLEASFSHTLQAALQQQNQDLMQSMTALLQGGSSRRPAPKRSNSGGPHQPGSEMIDD